MFQRTRRSLLAGIVGAYGLSVGAANATCVPLVCPGAVGCDAQLGSSSEQGEEAQLGYDINAGTGNLSLTYRDITVYPALGPNLVFNRFYNSQGNVIPPSRVDVGLGAAGWTHTYSWNVAAEGPNIVVRTDVARAIRFTPGLFGAWVPAIGEFGTLTGSASTGFVYTTKYGKKFTFDTLASSGRLLSITPPSNTPIRVQYSAGTVIASVTSGDKSLLFSYVAGPGGTHLLHTITDPSGTVWTYNYTGANLTSVQFPHHDSAGVHGAEFYTYTDVTANGVTFTASGHSNLITRIQQQQSGSTLVTRRLFSYTPDGFLAHAASSAVGGVLQNELSMQYVLCTNLPSTTVATLAGGSKTVTSAPIAGKQRITHIDATAGAGAPAEWKSVTYVWNLDGTLASVTDGNGVTTAYSNYDLRGNPQTEVQGFGSLQARTTTIAYHPVLSTPLSVSRLSVDNVHVHKKVYDYDADYNGTYNQAPTNFLHQVAETGQTDTTLTGAPNVAATYSSQMFYDAQNRVTRYVLPNGHLRTATYWPAGAANNAGNRLRTIDIPTSGATVLTTTYDAYDGVGRLLRYAGYNGEVSGRVYDEIGRILQKSLSAPGTPVFADSYQYDLGAGMLAHVTPEGTVVRQEYDAAYRLWRRHADTAAATTAWSEVFDFTSHNQVATSRRFVGLGNDPGTGCSAGGAEEFCEERAWDAFLRLQSVRTLDSNDQTCNGLACQLRLDYDGNGSLRSKTEVGSNVLSMARDSLNQVAQITLPTGVIASLGYDANGHINARRDPKDFFNGGTGGSRLEQTTYDDFGRLISAVTLDSGTLISNFDGAGLRVAAKDASGKVTTYSYDNANRLVAAVSGAPHDSMAYTYDETGGIGELPFSFTRGKLTTIAATDPGGGVISSHFSYDLFGHVQDDVEERGGSEGTSLSDSHFAWGANGELLTERFPDGIQLTFSYPTTGGYAPVPRPSAITATFQATPKTLASAIRYASDGMVAGLTYGNGSLFSVTRNKRGERKRLMSGTDVDQRYDYDSGGRGTLVAVHHFQGTSRAWDWNFGTDALNRLASYKTNVRPGLETYLWSYDEVGNRTSQTFNKGAPSPQTGVCPPDAPQTGDQTIVISFPKGALARDQIALAASASLTILGNAVVKEPSGVLAPVTSVGSVATTFGSASQVGSTWSQAAVQVGSGALVGGSVTSHSTVTVTPPGVVTGTITQNATLTPFQSTNWTVTFPATTNGDVGVLPATIVNLAPGAYGTISVASLGTLALRSGTYFADTWHTAPGSQVTIDSSNGPVRVYVRTSIDLDGPIVDSGNHSGLLVAYLGTGPVVMIAPFLGTFVAPNASIELAPVLGGHFGAFFGQSVQVDPLALVTHVPFVGWTDMPCRSILTAYGYGAGNTNRLASATDATGATQSWSYDPNGFVTAATSGGTSFNYGYDSNNRVASIRNGAGTTLAAITYSAFGRWQRTDAAGTWSQSYYDWRGRLLEEFAFNGRVVFNSPAYDIIDHVYLPAGGGELARLVRRLEKPSASAGYAFIDAEVRYVHEDFRGGPASVENASGRLWMGEVDPFGAIVSQGLPGPDGKIGTADDTPASVTELTGPAGAEIEPLDQTLISAGAQIMKPSIGGRAYTPSLGSELNPIGATSYASNGHTGTLALLAMRRRKL